MGKDIQEGGGSLLMDLIRMRGELLEQWQLDGILSRGRGRVEGEIRGRRKDREEEERER